MPSSTLAPYFYLAAISLLLLLPASAQTLLGQTCEIDGNYSSGSPWFQKRDQLMTYLIATTPPTGYSNATVGTWFPERVSGLALCRIDLSASDCQSCIVKASQTAQKMCPNNAGAIVWYETCFLRYSSRSFLGAIDTEDNNMLCNPSNAKNSTEFNRRITRLLSWMANETATVADYYSIGEAGPTKNAYIYALTQCTRDLSPGNCLKCLYALVGMLPLCGGALGARIDTGSCNLRYETYKFLR